MAANRFFVRNTEEFFEGLVVLFGKKTDQSGTVVTSGYENSRLFEIGRLKFPLCIVIHPDWHIRSNFRLRMRDNLHTD